MACPNDHPLAIDELEPRSFSFNSPYGACPDCTGIGTRMEVDPELLVPDDELTLAEGAIAPVGRRAVGRLLPAADRALADELGFTMDTPWRALPERARKALLYGQDHQVHVRYRNRYGRERSYYDRLRGRRSRSSSAGTPRPSPTRAASATRATCARCPCPACEGARLKPNSLAVSVGGQSIAEVCAHADPRGADFLRGLELTDARAADRRAGAQGDPRAARLPARRRAGLPLARPAAGTLSGGEAQRIRLATQIGSGLVGVLYVLDEPSIGLHQRDNRRLIETLTRLRDLGNTLIVVEHDEDTIRAADWVVDIGPGAGEHGGQVVALRARSRTCSTTPTR